MKNQLFTYISKSFNAVPSLSENLAQYLKQETITETSQGKIIKDIEFLVNFLQANEVKVSQNNYFFGLKYLPEINQALSYPIETNLKRPVQKSYPYIDGLYLILRGSGLGQIVSKGKSHYFKINEDILSQWQQLNLTEKYFSLLECYFTQPQLSLYFPEWHNTLVLCDYEFTPALYIMTIYLNNVWRKISIPNSIYLDEVVEIIMDFFDFDPLHLHKFIYQDPTGNICYLFHPETDLFYEREECDYSNKYRLGDIPFKIGESLTLIFDLRQEWEFSLTLEQIELLSSANQEPQLLESKGEAPDNSQDDFILIHF